MAAASTKKTAQATEAARAWRWEAARARAAAAAAAPPGSAGVGMRIKCRRTSLKISIKVLAPKVAVGQGTLVRWEKGLSIPGVDDIERLAEELQTTPADLVQWPPAAPARLTIDSSADALDTEPADLVQPTEKAVP